MLTRMFESGLLNVYCLLSLFHSLSLSLSHSLSLSLSHTHTDWFSATDDSGAYLFDRSPEYFEPLLNFLRHGKLILNEGINPQGTIVLLVKVIILLI